MQLLQIKIFLQSKQNGKTFLDEFLCRFLREFHRRILCKNFFILSFHFKLFYYFYQQNFHPTKFYCPQKDFEIHDFFPQ